MPPCADDSRKVAPRNFNTSKKVIHTPASVFGDGRKFSRITGSVSGSPIASARVRASPVGRVSFHKSALVFLRSDRWPASSEKVHQETVALYSSKKAGINTGPNVDRAI